MAVKKAPVKKAVAAKPVKTRFFIGGTITDLQEAGDYFTFEEFMQSDAIQDLIVEDQGLGDGEGVVVVSHPILTNDAGNFEHDKSVAKATIQTFALETGKPKLVPFKTK